MRSQKPLVLTEEKDLEQFIGTSVYMSIVQLPGSRSYWNLNLNHRLISDVTPCNRWEEIKLCLHFANNDDAVAVGNPGRSKPFEILTVFIKLRSNNSKVSIDEYLAINEYNIHTKTRSS